MPEVSPKGEVVAAINAELGTESVNLTTKRAGLFETPEGELERTAQHEDFRHTSSQIRSALETTRALVEELRAVVAAAKAEQASQHDLLVQAHDEFQGAIRAERGITCKVEPARAAARAIVAIRGELAAQHQVVGEMRLAVQKHSIDQSTIRSELELIMRLVSPPSRTTLAGLRSINRWVRGARRAARRNDWPTAERYYRRALIENPERSATWVQYGHSLKAQGCTAVALEAYRHALTLRPNNPDTFLQIGHALKLLGSLDEAGKYYRRSFELSPSSKAARLELERYGWTLPEYVCAILEAASDGEKSEQKNLISEAKFWYFRARARSAARRRNWRDAASFYNIALKHNPQNARAWIQFGHALREAGDVVEAVFAYLQGYVLQPSTSDAPTHLRALVPESFIRGSFDVFYGTNVSGWAIDLDDPKRPLLLEAICDGHVLGTGEARQFRGDLLTFNEGFCAFKIDIGSAISDFAGKAVSIRIAGTNILINGSPKPIKEAHIIRYLRPDRGVSLSTLPRLKRMMNNRVSNLLLSIVMPVYNTPSDWLIEAIQSVRNQWCDRWELICVNDNSTDPNTGPVLEDLKSQDIRIRVINSSENLGIAGATNLGIRAANGQYIAFLDHDDYLEPDAVYHLLNAAVKTQADLIYSDEAITSQSINDVIDIRARPAFSYDYYLSHPYFVHMVCVRTEAARLIGGWDVNMKISADVDFILRIIERSNRIVHVPRVIYRWRTHDGSAGHSLMEQVMSATCASIQRHLDRSGSGATVEPGVSHNQFRVTWPASGGRILIIIPTKNRSDLVKTAVESIERTSRGIDYTIVVVDHQSDLPESRAYLEELSKRHTVMRYEGPFNYSHINNVAFRKYREGNEFVLFLNNDIEAFQDGWLDRLRRIANRPEIGAVGTLLLYPDKRIQHAGVLLGFNGSADHAFKFESAYLNGTDKRNLGYNCSLTSVRDFSAVTAACLMMRSDVFHSLKGFDENLVVGFNDTDLCLRVRAAGLKVLYDGETMLFHYESATRRNTKEMDHPEDSSLLLSRHADIIQNGDPFYSPNLSPINQDHLLREDNGCKNFRFRVTEMNIMSLDDQSHSTADSLSFDHEK